MAEQSGFFDAYLVGEQYDREYFAEHFAKYFASFIGNGVFGGKSSELMVKQKEIADMSITVLPGQAWINGYWYENDEELSLAIDIADGAFNRIDLIVLRWDNSERAIRLAVKKGTSAVNAAAPILQRNADYFELKLAEIYIKAGTTAIRQENITDTRLNMNVCGLVQGVVQQFDTTEFGKQIDSFIESFEASNTAKMNAVLAKLNALADNNDIASVILDVEALKTIAIESTDYKGCYYRVFEGRTEWINPPSQYGIEYCTTERWQNKPVYQKTFYVASLPDSSIMSFEIDSHYQDVISISGYAVDTDNNYHHPFPVIVSGVTPIAVISGFEGDGGDGGGVVIRTTEDVTSMQAYITVKYTKR